MVRSLEQPSAPKRLIVCCDGTWQSSVSGEENVPSNVTRLTRSLASAGLGADGRVWQQVVYYDSGIGTGDLTVADKVVQGGVGKGLEINVLEAYNFLVMNYNPGDEIFCFGFSRGAYTARAIAGLVTDVGICTPGSLSEFPKLYKTYKLHTDGTPFTESVHYRHFTFGMPDMEKTMRHIHQNKDLKLDFKTGQNVIWKYMPGDYGMYWDSRILKVVGVWDTVGALGVPDIHGINMSWLGYHPNFHNVRISPYIENAFHALALDEHRSAFGPTMWYIPHESLYEKRDKETPEQRATRVKAAEKIFHKDHEACCKEWASFYGDEFEDQPPRDENNKPRKTNLAQCWFPGMHINVGGGSDDPLQAQEGDLEELSNITYLWMLEQVSPFLAFKNPAIEYAIGEHTQFIANIRHRPVEVTKVEKWGELAGIEAKEKYRKYTKAGWGTGPIIDSFTGATSYAGSEYRQPMQEKTKINDKKVPISQLGETNESIHPVVAWRIERLKNAEIKYAPGGLKKWKRQVNKDKNGFEYVNVEAKLILPEYVIRDVHGPSVERQALLAVEDAQTWLAGVDKVTGGAKSEAT